MLEPDPDREARLQKIAATGKYDRKAIKARIELEEWLDTHLAELYGSEEVPELDLDEVRLTTHDNFRNID